MTSSRPFTKALLVTLLLTTPLRAGEGEEGKAPTAEAEAAPREPEEAEGNSEGAKPSVREAEPSAQAKKEAAERFQRGLSFYEDGDYSLALIEFERAYQLVPDYRVLYNIGQVSIQLSRASQALRALERYLEEGGGALGAERVEAVQRDLDMLKARTAHLKVEGTEGAEVFLDDESLGSLPLPEALLIDAGRHTLEVRKPGYRSFSERVTLAGAEERLLEVALEKIPEVAPVVASPSPPEEEKPAPDVLRDVPPSPEQRRSPYALIGWSATGALAGGAVLTGVLGLSAAGKVKDLKSEPNPSADELEKKANTAKSFFLAADILGAAAIVTGGVSLYFTFGGSKEGKQTAAGRPPSSTPWGVQVSADSVQLTGRF